MDNPVIIFGAGGIGKAALNIFRKNSVEVYCFLDDDKSLHNTEISEVSIMSHTEDDGFLKFIGKKCEAFVAVDDMKLRKSLVEMLNDNRHVQPVNCVHPDASIAETATIGHGNFINIAQVGAFAKIGQHCMINSGAIIEHEVDLGDFVQIGAGAVINAGVKIEDGAFIGSGAIVVSGVTIGKNARIGAGSVVIATVKNGETVFGNPAQKVK